MIPNYSETCIKRSPMGQTKSGLTRQVTSCMFNSYEIFYDETRQVMAKAHIAFGKGS